MTVVLQLAATREEGLLRELRTAIGATSAQDLSEWGGRTIGILSEVTLRRGKNFSKVVAGIWDFVTKETEGLLTAIRQGEALPHAQGRASAARSQAGAFGQDYTAIYNAFSSNLKNRPRETAPKVVAGVLGFLIGSGGVDGDGGVPDLDFLGGIGAHRSILTHSILAGIIVETLVLGVLDLSRTIYKNLPEKHDPLWEELNNATAEVFAALSAGLSAGIAYHLGVDATIDGGGTYKGLPVSLPQAVHGMIMGANAATEGADVGKRLTEGSTTKIEGNVFRTFREAAEFAKRDRGWVIVRASDGQRFRVLRKVPRDGNSSLKRSRPMGTSGVQPRQHAASTQTVGLTGSSTVSDREARAARALAALGAQRFSDFARHIRTSTDCTAVRLLNEALDEGRPVQEVFFTGGQYGFQLDMQEADELSFDIHFGCLAGPLAGDGGRWHVTFDSEGAVIRALERATWRS